MTTPWDTIVPAQGEPVWKLRSATARYSLYRGRDSQGAILFLFEFEGDHADILRRLPRIAGIDLDYRRFANPRRHGLILRLTDSGYAELFSVLCEDLAETVEPLESERQAILSFLNRLGRWQELLASGARSLLGPEEVRGLMGELQVLEMLLSDTGCDALAMVTAWTGPSGASQDFEFPGQAIEVKATGETGSRLVRISSEFQLDTADKPVTLVICHLPVTEDASAGRSLNRTVARIAEALPREALKVFEGRLSLARYVDIPEYDTPLFEAAAIDCYEVRSDFPCLARHTLPAGISGVRYDLDIAQLAEFRVPDLPEVGT